MRQAFHAGHAGHAALCEEDYFACEDGSLLPISWLITPFSRWT